MEKVKLPAGLVMGKVLFISTLFCQGLKLAMIAMEVVKKNVPAVRELERFLIKIKKEWIENDREICRFRFLCIL